MSSIVATMDGNYDEFLSRLKELENIDISGVMNALGEGLRSSTVERFSSGESPEGKAWEASIRAESEGGKTLVKTTRLRTSIHVKSNSDGFAVGTNDIRAATHQFGDERTIKAKNGTYLRFQIAGEWKRVEKVDIKIPARPFLGISDKDEDEIKSTLESLFEE